MWVTSKLIVLPLSIVVIFTVEPVDFNVLKLSVVPVLSLKIPVPVPTFNPVLKNTSYNMLDVVSKNFYGIFLSFLIFKLR